MSDFPSDMRASGLVDETAPGDNAPPMSVSAVAQALKRVVEGEFGHVRLRGELSGVKRAASGHIYLSLKDDAAVIDGVIWKGSAAALGFAPQDGVEVIATGKLTTYPGRSKYQIVIERMTLAGEGALMALLEKVKAQLAAEGLFDRASKQRLPFLPRVIGVVTSPTGAVIRDILHRLADRFPSHVLVWPVLVQGDGAAAQVAAAVRGFDTMAPGGPVPRPDLVIVARGGGSIEDLWAFNEEIVVRAIAACSIPIISAVGHETDTTLADFAADARAPTPTAAAEMAVPVRAELAATVAELALRSGRSARRAHGLARERLEALTRLLPRREALLGPQRQRADDCAARLDRALEARVMRGRRLLDRAGGVLRPAMLVQRASAARAGFDALARLFPRHEIVAAAPRLRAETAAARLHRGFAARLSAGQNALDRAGGALRPGLLHRQMATARDRLERTARLLGAVNPDALLTRGYVRVSARGGAAVLTASAAQAAQALRLHFVDGAVDARVEQHAPLAYDKPVEKPKAAPKARPDQPTLF